MLIHLAFLSTAVLAAPVNFDKRQEACPPFHIIAARGAGEAPGPGSLLSIAEKVMAVLPGTTLESVDFPTSPTPVFGDWYDILQFFKGYVSSTVIGTEALKEQLFTFVQECPNTRVALLGNSGGAHIVGDGLGGGSLQGFTDTSPVDPSVMKSVAAVILYGDVRQVAEAPFNVGTGTQGGVSGSITLL